MSTTYRKPSDRLFSRRPTVYSTTSDKAGMVPSLAPGEELVIENRKNRHGEQVYRRYGKGRLLGKGGFAQCFEMRDLETGERYAGKVIDKRSLVKKKAKEKLISEIKIHRSLRHRYIVGFDHTFDYNGNVYIILELCKNQTMMELLRRRQRLTEGEIGYYMYQILGAVQYMHVEKIIHRDLKLGNLFLNDRLEIKIGDFGLAAQLQHDGERKRTICGTPNYIAPEVLEGSRDGHSFEVDIWSIGVILYTIAVGKPPFETTDVKTTYRKIRTNSYSFPPDVKISDHCRDLIVKILHPTPMYRPSLDDILNHAFFRVTRIPSSLPPSALHMPPDLSHPSSHFQHHRSNSTPALASGKRYGPGGAPFAAGTTSARPGSAKSGGSGSSGKTQSSRPSSSSHRNKASSDGLRLPLRSVQNAGAGTTGLQEAAPTSARRPVSSQQDLRGKEKENYQRISGSAYVTSGKRSHTLTRTNSEPVRTGSLAHTNQNPAPGGMASTREGKDASSQPGSAAAHTYATGSTRPRATATPYENTVPSLGRSLPKSTSTATSTSGNVTERPVKTSAVTAALATASAETLKSLQNMRRAPNRLPKAVLWDESSSEEEDGKGKGKPGDSARKKQEKEIVQDGHTGRETEARRGGGEQVVARERETGAESDSSSSGPDAESGEEGDEDMVTDAQPCVPHGGDMDDECEETPEELEEGACAKPDNLFAGDVEMGEVTNSHNPSGHKKAGSAGTPSLPATHNSGADDNDDDDEANERQELHVAHHELTKSFIRYDAHEIHGNGTPEKTNKAEDSDSAKATDVPPTNAMDCLASEPCAGFAPYNGKEDARGLTSAVRSTSDQKSERSPAEASAPSVPLFHRPGWETQWEHECVWVSKWVDYSSKYGVGYLLSDNTMGVWFNDHTKMAMALDSQYVEYIERRHGTYRAFDFLRLVRRDDYPQDLSKKITLLKHFRDYLLEHTPRGHEVPDSSRRPLQRATPDAPEGPGLVYVKKWYRTQSANIFRLSNKCIQVCFKDFTEIVLSSEARIVTYRDKQRKRTSYPLSAIPNDRPDLVKRLRYTKEILFQFITFSTPT